jgi:exonuclease III
MGTEGRGTAILIKEGIHFSNLKRLPSGRGMALHLQNICTITDYAPSGENKRREREDFFAVDVPNLIPNTPKAMILAGDFNCNLDSGDSTGRQNYSRALKNLIVNLDL